MKNEVFSRIIEKTVNNGFDIDPYDFALKKFEHGWDIFDTAWLDFVIFNHDFAKAFWGEAKKEYYGNIGPGVFLFEWQYHLQWMVLEENPIEYLSKFL